MKTNAIIVGTDGTGSSDAAVKWAAREAQRRGRPLRIVHAFDWDWHESRYDIGNEYVDVTRSIAEAVTAAAFDQARAIAPTIRIDRVSLIGHATDRLLDLTERAELMVLGSRGRGGFAALLLGSVSQRVAAHASCPVVVVRGEASLAEGPVAAGVDDSPIADHVLGTAFDAAASRGCALTVVRAYLPVIPLWLANVRATDIDTPEQDMVEQARLEEQLAPWRSKYPDVPVGTLLTHASVSGALVGVSSTAQLVIVGSRGRGAIAGALLGSAGLQLLQHANCPVYIDRPQST